MRVSADVFWAEKAGNSTAEYEDAFWPDDSLIDEEARCFRFAVADGATDSCFSGAWARQLVRAYCEGDLEATGFADSLPTLEGNLRKEVLSKGKLPWYLEEKVEDGAFATLVGLTLEGSSEGGVEGTWRAVAVGDSCLFQLRKRSVVVSFPLGDASSFTNSPLLLSSRPDRNEVALAALNTYQGVWRAGDSFYLMTDALACWCFQQLETKRVPWRRFEDFDKRADKFRSWIGRLRATNGIRNDDVTLVRIEIPHPHDS